MPSPPSLTANSFPWKEHNAGWGPGAQIPAPPASAACPLPASIHVTGYRTELYPVILYHVILQNAVS